eukprot:1381243-Lingulodinium_polyedra.AAC.1
MDASAVAHLGMVWWVQREQQRVLVHGVCEEESGHYTDLRFDSQGSAWVAGEGQTPLKAQDLFSKSLVLQGNALHIKDLSGGTGPPLALDIAKP